MRFGICWASDVDTTSLLPADDTGFGFDNIADVLSVSPMLMERYLSAALKISRIAVGDVTLRPTTDIFAVNKYLRQDDRVDNNLPFGSRAGLAVQYYFPVDADYVVKLFFTRTYDGRFRGTGEAHQLEVRLNGETIRDAHGRRPGGAEPCRSEREAVATPGATCTRGGRPGSAVHREGWAGNPRRVVRAQDRGA
jgi:hypothetical protein